MLPYDLVIPRGHGQSSWASHVESGPTYAVGFGYAIRGEQHRNLDRPPSQAAGPKALPDSSSPPERELSLFSKNVGCTYAGKCATFAWLGAPC
jgi:hypothetical protein